MDPAQAQTPAVQLLTGGHWVAQLPQWSTSVWRLTHAPVVPAPQTSGAVLGQAHVPPEQLSLRRGQTAWQFPQWAGSVAMSTHAGEPSHSFTVGEFEVHVQAPS
jgi:hypothetical protein